MDDKFPPPPSPWQTLKDFLIGERWVATRKVLKIVAWAAFLGAWLFIFFSLADHTKQALTKEYNHALELIDQGEYIAAWELLDKIGYDWGDVKETMASIADEYEQALQARKDETVVASLPSLSYQEQKEALASMYDKEKSDALYLEYSLKEAYRLYNAQEYYEALGLFLIIPEDLRSEDFDEIVFDCLNHISDKIQAD